MRKSLLAAVAATTLFASAASASVIFDSNGGTGFVGKGDIQVLYGWNNQKLQQNAGGVAFSYDATDVYDVECYWETVTGQGRIIVHDINVPRHTRVNASVAYDARRNSSGKNGDITCFNLSGFGSTTTNGTVPAVGGTCPGQSQVATIIAVTLVSSSGGLSVSWGGTSYPLPNTPVL
jgi:hypothetical protein